MLEGENMSNKKMEKDNVKEKQKNMNKEEEGNYELEEEEEEENRVYKEWRRVTWRRNRKNVR